MGSACLKAFDEPIDKELQELKSCLAVLLEQLNPEDLLTLAIEDSEIYEICEENSTLRQACIIAAVRRYHIEKFFFEEVHNRTADYMVMLDRFVQIQDEEDRKEMEKESKSCFPWFIAFKRSSDDEDDPQNGASTSA